MINTEHKDRLFCFIFGNEENKKWTLSLYNAVNGSAHTDPGMIQITTMKDVLYMGMKNDVSFMIADIMSIYEQQSIYNPNMPIRELMYAAKLYDKYIHEHKLNIYGGKLVRLPVPKLLVFYNGIKDHEDEILELKDAFEPEEKGADTEIKEENMGRKVIPDIAVRVRMININYGQNKEVLNACKPLKEYAWLIQRIRDYKKQEEEIEDAVSHAINDLPEDFEIRTFLVGHKAEVKDMCITEYNEAETMQMIREEGREEGRQDNAHETAERMIQANEPGDKITLYTGLEKGDVDRLAKKMNTVLVWNVPKV